MNEWFSKHSKLSLWALVWLLLPACGGIRGCEPEGGAKDSATEGAAVAETKSDGKAAASYTTRGTIMAVQPASAKPQSSAKLQIHHDAIADFKDRSGKVVGMKSMVMGFHLGPKVKATGIKRGDRVEFRFEVRWQGDEPLRITALKAIAQQADPTQQSAHDTAKHDPGNGDAHPAQNGDHNHADESMHNHHH